MALTVGTRLGSYEITGALGAGGMGEVYRARDTRLNRDVALKILPEAFASDPDRLARFTREAETLASLGPFEWMWRKLAYGPNAHRGQVTSRNLHASMRDFFWPCPISMILTSSALTSLSATPSRGRCTLFETSVVNHRN